MGLSHSPSLVLNGLTLCLDAANTKSILSTVEVLVVAGGGAGGGYHGGGGGGGGVIYSSSHSITPGSAITATVGAGGGAPNSSSNTGNPGGNSLFGALTAIGGGAGISQSNEAQARNNGGSGGGGCDGSSSVNHPGGSGTSGQGFKGGDVFGSGPQLAVWYGTAGGGGAGGVGGDGGVINGGFGGSGLPFSISGNLAYYGGGGGGTHLGSAGITNYGIGGIGGGGTGGISPSPHNSAIRNSSSGVDGTGGGGGGHLYSNLGGGAGGSGIVIVRYPGSQRASGGTVTFVAGHTIHTFTTSGTFTPNGAPGTGTIWTDFSNNGNSGTLTNGPTYSSANGGSFVFDGVNDYVTLSSPIFNIFSTISIFSFIRFNTTSKSCQIFDTRDSSGDGLSFLMSNPTGNVLYASLNSSNIAGTTTIQSGVIYYVGLTYDGSTAKLYFNANEDNSESITETFNVTANPTIAVRSFSIGSASKGSCNIYLTKIYNRALSAAEIQQNYNALKSRYI